MHRGSGSRDSGSRKIVFQLHSPRNRSVNAAQTPLPLMPPPPPTSSSRTRAPRPDDTALHLNDAALHLQRSPRFTLSQTASPSDTNGTPAFELAPWESFTPFSAVKVNPSSPPPPPLNLILFVQPQMPSPRDLFLSNLFSSAQAHPSPRIASPPNASDNSPGNWALDASATAPAPPAPDEWAAFGEDWGDSKFDAASISVVVNDLDWEQSHQASKQGATGSVVKRTVFVSLRRVLKLFNARCRVPLQLHAFHMWHSILRIRERRRWVASFCQTM